MIMERRRSEKRNVGDPSQGCSPQGGIIEPTALALDKLEKGHSALELVRHSNLLRVAPGNKTQCVEIRRVGATRRAELLSQVPQRWESVRRRIEHHRACPERSRRMRQNPSRALRL